MSINSPPIAVALSSIGIRSAIVPAPKASGDAPKAPWRNRKAITIPMLVLNPQDIVQMMKRALQIWYNGNLPYISLRGAITVIER